MISPFSEPHTRLLIATIAFLVGVAVGFVIWRQQSNASKGVSSLQILSTFVFFGYIIICAMINTEPSDLIATAIITMLGGEVVGEALTSVRKRGK